MAFDLLIKNGRVVEGNFDQYRLARMEDYPPQVNIQFLKTNNKWISGVGEEAIPQIAPAIAQEMADMILGKCQAVADFDPRRFKKD